MNESAVFPLTLKELLGMFAGFAFSKLLVLVGLHLHLLGTSAQR